MRSYSRGIWRRGSEGCSGMYEYHYDRHSVMRVGMLSPKGRIFNYFSHNC